jgi:transposase
VHCHANARVTPRRRAEVFEAVEAGMTVRAACLAFRVSRRWYYRWLPRWRAEGHGGMLERSSRPLRSPQLLSRAQEEQIVLLRRLHGWGPDRIAALTGVPRSTVHRVIRRRGLRTPRRAPEPIVRYEFGEPGGLLHVDTKKLGRIVAGPGHRVHGDRRIRARGAGWEVLHVAIDDATRLVYCEVLADERGRTAALFLVRALCWYRQRGLHVQRVLTDNGSPAPSGCSHGHRLLGQRQTAGDHHGADALGGDLSTGAPCLVRRRGPGGSGCGGGGACRCCQVTDGLIPPLLRRRADPVTVIGGAVVRKVAGSPDGRAARRGGGELPIP